MGEKSCSRPSLLVWQKWHSPYTVVLVVLWLPVVFLSLLCAKVLIFFDIQILFCTFVIEFKTNNN